MTKNEIIAEHQLFSSRHFRKLLIISMTDYKKNLIVELYQLRSLNCKNEAGRYLQDRYLITVNGKVKHRYSSLEKSREMIDKYFHN